MAPVPQSMTAIAITTPGGPEALQPQTVPVPAPKAGQVLVKVAAAGVNRPDVQQRMGAYPPPKDASPLPGLEISGEVVAVGPDVGRWKAGDKVCALVNGGGYAEYCVAEERLALPMPDRMDEFSSAALPEALFTLWHNLFGLARLQPGESLLVHGGASGVGTMAIQIAKQFGVQVIATAGSEEKVKTCKELGAIAVANYHTEDFVKVVQQATGGRGVDVILDMVGGLYAERNLAALAPDGRITHLTTGNAPRYEVDLAAIMQKRAIVTGSMLRPLPLARKATIAEELRVRVWPLIGKSVTPVIDSIFPLEAAEHAHARMESGVHIGKILLDCRAPAA